MDDSLKGDLVRLRPVERRDLGALMEWYNRPDIFPFMARDVPVTMESQTRWFEGLKDDPSTEVFAVEEIATGDLIGSITLRNLTDPARRGELGLLVSRQGSGYGSDAIRVILRYAFEVKRMQCVSLEVRGDNRIAITAYMRTGFRPEGVLRRRLLKGGVMHDLYSLSILPEEFYEDKPR